MESQVLEAYEGLVSAFREGRHSIHLRQRTNTGEETVHERETICSPSSPMVSGWWSISTYRPNRTESIDARRLLRSEGLHDR